MAPKDLTQSSCIGTALQQHDARIPAPQHVQSRMLGEKESAYVLKIISHAATFSGIGIGIVRIGTPPSFVHLSKRDSLQE